MRTVLSRDPDAMNLPSGEMETDDTPPECPVSVAVQAPEAISQMRTVLSRDPDAMNLPSGEMETDLTDISYDIILIAEAFYVCYIMVILINDNLIYIYICIYI